MRAGLEGDIERAAAGTIPGFVQRQDFSVLYVRIGVIAASYDFATFHQHRADSGIRTGAPHATPGQFQRFVHPRVFHVANSDAMNLSGSKGNRSAACSPTPT